MTNPAKNRVEGWLPQKRDSEIPKALSVRTAIWDEELSPEECFLGPAQDPAAILASAIEQHWSVHAHPISNPAWDTSTTAQFIARLSDNLRMAELEREVRELREQSASLWAEIHKLKVEAPSNKEHLGVESQDPCIRDVVAATQELFSGQITIEVEHDPEDPSDGIVVFGVKYPGEVTEIVQKHCDWNDRMSQVRPGFSGKLRLIVYPE